MTKRQSSKAFPSDDGRTKGYATVTRRKGRPLLWITWRVNRPSFTINVHMLLHINSPVCTHPPQLEWLNLLSWKNSLPCWPGSKDKTSTKWVPLIKQKLEITWSLHVSFHCFSSCSLKHWTPKSNLCWLWSNKNGAILLTNQNWVYLSTFLMVPAVLRFLKQYIDSMPTSKSNIQTCQG